MSMHRHGEMRIWSIALLTVWDSLSLNQSYPFLKSGWTVISGNPPVSCIGRVSGTSSLPGFLCGNWKFEPRFSCSHVYKGISATEPSQSLYVKYNILILNWWFVIISTFRIYRIIQDHTGFDRFVVPSPEILKMVYITIDSICLNTSQGKAPDLQDSVGNHDHGLRTVVLETLTLKCNKGVWPLMGNTVSSKWQSRISTEFTELWLAYRVTFSSGDFHSRC